ncbi:lipoyl domain-containing protein, partial [Myxococcota bacterium]|nr:lipoyl domain-containing protein [Myxococcota bacterium]
MSNGSETRVQMPQLGESIVEATIVRWRVAVGDSVVRGQTLAEVETDKATSEIPAPRAGTIAALLADEGATLAVGTPILVMREATSAAATPPSATASARVEAATSARPSSEGTVTPP